MHKEFRTKFELKSLDFILFFAKEVPQFIGEGGKGKGHLGEPRDKEGKGHLGMGKGLLELCRHWSQRTSSRIFGVTTFKFSKKVVCCQ